MIKHAYGIVFWRVKFRQRGSDTFNVDFKLGFLVLFQFLAFFVCLIEEHVIIVALFLLIIF